MGNILRIIVIRPLEHISIVISDEVILPIYMAITLVWFPLQDWSLITGTGGGGGGGVGATKREGGHMKFYPYEKGGQKRF